MFRYQWLTLHLFVLFILSSFLVACGQDETLSLGQACPNMQSIVLNANTVCEAGDLSDALCDAYASYFDLNQCPSRFPRCVEGHCQSACGPMMLACDGVCINPKNDNRYCGASGLCEEDSAGQTCLEGTVCKEGQCQVLCPRSQVYCDGKCIDPESDSAYCGAQEGCAEYSTCLEGEVCQDSECRSGCLTGFVLCDGRCIDPLIDRQYCGASNDCHAVHAGAVCNARQVCDAGKCRTGCSDGKVICGGSCIDPLTDQQYCGASESCGGFKSCLYGQVCRSGLCIDVCPETQIMCSDICINPEEDLRYCGASTFCSENPGVSCLAAVVNAHDVACVGGLCEYNVCKTDFKDCDGDVSNGCEGDLMNASEHCGACYNDCSKLDNVDEVKCLAGVCEIISCAEDFGDCDGEVSNGCETDLTVSASHCGVCDKECSVPDNAHAVCIEGICDYTCLAGFKDCDGEASNGCEADLNTSLEHCGGCDIACSKPANTSAAACAAGVCGYTSCITDFANCDKDPSTGCETNTRTSSKHCGSCNNTCLSTEACAGGKCIPVV